MGMNKTLLHVSIDPQVLEAARQKIGRGEMSGMIQNFLSTTIIGQEEAKKQGVELKTILEQQVAEQALTIEHLRDQLKNAAKKLQEAEQKQSSGGAGSPIIRGEAEYQKALEERKKAEKFRDEAKRILAETVKVKTPKEAPKSTTPRRQARRNLRAKK